MLAPIFFNAMLVATALLVIKYGYAAYFFITRRNEMTVLASLISHFKLRLRTKLKHRFNSQGIHGTSELKAIIEPIADQMALLDFVDNKDYQKLLTGISDIIQAIDVNEILEGDQKIHMNSNQLNLAPEAQMMKKSYEAVFEFDKDIVYFIVEICKLTEQYIILANQYNHYTKYEKQIKKITDIPEKIEIQSFNILEDIYNGYKKELELMKSLGNDDGIKKAS